MPPTYGGTHDYHGVNLVNLRASTNFAGGSRINRESNALRPDVDWRKEVAQNVSLAETIKTVSSAVRDQAEQMEASFDARTKSAEDQVTEALRSRLLKVDGLKAVIQGAMVENEKELIQLEGTAGKLQAALAKKLEQLALNERRLELRAARPAREMVNDQVHSLLIQQQKLLQGSVEKLRRCLKASDSEAERVMALQAKLEKDFEDKLTALDLDSTCLDMRANPGGVAGPLRRPLLRYPHNWAKATEEGVHEASFRRQNARRLRAAVAATIDERRSVERQTDKFLEDAIRVKTYETADLKDSLAAELQAVYAELEEAKARRAALEASLAAKAEPLALTQQRYSLRRQRPTRELVQDEVEDALTQELTSLHFIQTNIGRKIAVVDREIAHLQLTARQLEANLADKASALEMDTRMLRLDQRARDGRGELLRSEAGFSVSSAKAYSIAQGRIAELESTLRRMRSEREGLEGQIGQLAGQVEGAPA